MADLVNISSVAGRKPNASSGVYNLTKFGVNAFSEAMRMEMVKRHLRVSLVEPGFVKTELPDHIRPELQEWARNRYVGVEMLEADDIADAIVYVVTRPRRVAVNEVLVRPSEQEFRGSTKRPPNRRRGKVISERGSVKVEATGTGLG